MPEDRSLDDFADADGADRESTETEGGGPRGDAGDSADAAEADPAVATSTWHTDGAECDRCGERVERRWRAEDAFVCADCASW